MRALAVLGLAVVSACGGDDDSSSSAVAATATHTGSADVDKALAAIIASCAEVHGDVEIRRRGQPEWEPARVGVTLRERDWVRTKPGGFARVRFSGGGFLELREGTTILVDKALSIESGSLVAVTEDGGSPIVVRAKDGSEAKLVAGAGGPGGRVRLTPTGSSLEIAVTQGDIKVVAGDDESAITSGEARDLGGHRVGDTIRLLGFPRSLRPGVDARFQFVPDMTVALAWKPVSGATHYRVQVAHDTQFEQLVLDTTTDGQTAAFTPTGIGDYAWRVAAIATDDRLGEFGFVRRMFLEEDPPRDLLVAPSDRIKFGFATKFPQVAFSWQSAGNAKTYKLVIHGADPDKPVVSLTTTKQRVVISKLREGVYHWGVYAIRDDGREQPIFLAPRALVIRKQRVKAHTEKLWNTGKH